MIPYQPPESQTKIVACQNLTVMVCPFCAGTYAVAETYIAQCRRLDHFKKTWVCPYCRTERGFNSSTVAKLADDLKLRDEAITDLTKRYNELKAAARRLKREVKAIAVKKRHKTIIYGPTIHSHRKKKPTRRRKP